MVTTIAILSPLLQKCARVNKQKHINNVTLYQTSLLIHVGFWGIVVFGIAPLAYSIIQHEPFTWIIKYVFTKTKRVLEVGFLGGMVGVFGISIPVVFRNRIKRFGIHTRRKYFHLVVIIMFPVIVWMDVSLS